MNARTYQEIMQSEQLEESLLVKYYLRQAANHQKYIQSLKKHNAPAEAIEKQVREKEQWIWHAIFTAQDEKKQGWKFVEDGERMLPMLTLQLEDAKRAERLEASHGN